MATSLRRLATNSGEAYRSALVPFSRASLYPKIPSKFLVNQFLRRHLCTAAPEVPSTGSGTPDALGDVSPGTDSYLDIAIDIDVEKLRAERAAYTEARRKKLERIADEVMALDKVEYKDYSAILRDKLCRGEKSLFDVKIEKFEPGAKFDVIRAILDFDDEIDLMEINDLLEGAPSVVKKDLVREEAEKIVEKLKEAGATAVVE